MASLRVSEAQEIRKEMSTHGNGVHVYIDCSIYLRTMEDSHEEQKWAIGTLSIFVILLIISGISDFVEVGIGVCTFLFSWLAVSYSIRNFGKGDLSKEELQKEIQVFSIILLIVLALITVLGVNQYSDYVFVTFGFTLTWIVRSSAIKYFS